MYMTIFWVCAAIAAAVFAVMIYSVATFPKSSGARPAGLLRHTLIEILWVAVPILIIICTAAPAVRTVAANEQAADSRLGRSVERNALHDEVASL